MNIMKRGLIVLVIFTSLFLLFSSLSLARSVTVSSSGELQKALNNKKIDYIYISPGTYYGNYTIKRGNLTLDGGKSVTFKPSSSKKPVIALLGPHIPMQRKSNITIKGIEIIGDGDGGEGIFVRNFTKVRLYDLTISRFKVGIHLYGTTYTDIYRSSVGENSTAIFIEDGETHYSLGIGISNVDFSDNKNAIEEGALGSSERVMTISNCRIKITESYWDTHNYAPVGIWNYYKNETSISGLELDYPQILNCLPLIVWKENYDNNARNFATEYLAIWDSFEKISKEYRDDMDYIRDHFCVPKEDDRLYSLYEKGLNSIQNMKVGEGLDYMRQYLSSIPPTYISKESIGCIIDAIETLIINPTFYSELFQLKNEKDLFSDLPVNIPEEIMDNQNIIRDYYLPLFWYSSNSPLLLKEFPSKYLYIDGKPLIDIIPDSPDIKVEIFRDNIILYKEYRENIKLARSFIKNIPDYIVREGILDYKDVRRAKNVLNSLKKASYIYDKIVRMELFDIPLSIILLEIEKEIKKAEKDKWLLKDIGIKYASYSPIRAKLVVSDSISYFWEEINREFKKKLKKNDFEELKQRAKTAPIWLKNDIDAFMEDVE